MKRAPHDVLAAAALAAALALAPTAAAAQVVDRVAAIVGSGVITLSDARAALAFGMVDPGAAADPLNEAVAYLVSRQLMLDEVNRYAEPAPDPERLSRRLAEVKGRFKDAASLQQAMDATAMTELRLRDHVSDTLRIESYLDQRFNAQAQPSPDEVERYYQDHQAEFATGGDVPPFEAVRPRVQARVLAERRAALIADWFDRLRRRSTVVIR